MLLRVVISKLGAANKGRAAALLRFYALAQNVREGEHTDDSVYGDFQPLGDLRAKHTLDCLAEIRDQLSEGTYIALQFSTR